MKCYETMWYQISDNFKDYTDYLMFESQNQELSWDSVWNKWAGNEGKKESYQLVNEINQKFVNKVRSFGGNNGEQHLMIFGYNTDIDVICDSLFKMPYDPANCCAGSVNYYTLASFAILEEDADWGKASSTWGTEDEFAELNDWMDMMKNNFVNKGIPVSIGEYGCPKKNKQEASVRLFLSSVCKSAYEKNLCPVLWDTPGGHYDHDECKLKDRQLKELYDEIAGNKNVTVDINGDGDVNVSDAVLLQKYLLGNGSLTNKQAIKADCDCNDSIDCFDMVVMRKLLIH